MNYVHVVTDDSVMVLNINDGSQVKFFSEDERYEKALEMVRDGNYEDVFAMDTKNIITNFFHFDPTSSQSGRVTVTIEDGVGYVNLNQLNMKIELHDAITKRVIKMTEQGFHPGPMLNFIENLYHNPSATAVGELFLFIEASELPITEDGSFIAYKIVRGDYMDIYSNTMSNKVGETCAMLRNLVDDNRENTCSKGLHFCSKGYLSSYGSSSRGNDRCMLVKINPADVVSIPSDYNNAKGRTWKYEVVGEVEGNWRETLPSTDYTSKAVVGNDAAEIDLDKSDAYKDGFATGYKDGYNDEIFEPASASPNKTQEQIDYDTGYDDGYDIGLDDAASQEADDSAW